MKVLVSLSTPASTTVSVTFTVTPGTATVGSDYKNVLPKTLIFLAGQRQKIISLAVLPDALHEGDETITVTLTNPSPTGSLTLGRAVGTVTINNDD